MSAVDIAWTIALTFSAGVLVWIVWWLGFEVPRRIRRIGKERDE